MASSDSQGKKEVSAANPGINLKFNTIDDEDEISRLLTTLDSVFAVSLIESKENVLKITDPNTDGPFMYFSYPYE